MQKNQQDGDEQAIQALIGSHFEGMKWTPTSRPDRASEMIENETEVNHDISGYLLVKDEGEWRIAAHAWDHASAQMPVPDYLR